MRAAVYARVSTERQERQQTIDSQLAALRAWAEAGGHELNDRHVFRDEGYSGSRLDRPGLDALRDAVRDGEVEILGVLAPDRAWCTDQRSGCTVPNPALAHAMRTDSGRPSSSIRFRTWTAMATSVARRWSVRDRSASPITRLWRDIAASAKARRL